MTVQEIWALGNFYNSVFSGEQIDAAIGIILNGGIDAAVNAAEASAAAAAKSAQEAAGSAAGLGDAATNAKNSATQAAASAEQARIYAEQAHAIAGEGLVFSVNNVQADETGNVPLGADTVGAIPVGEKGAAGGVAGLDDAGKVPAAQLPATMTPAAHAETHKQGGSDPLSPADIDAAPAGYGYGGQVINLGMVTEAELETQLTELLGTMQPLEAKQFCANGFVYSDWRFFGTLYKSSANYASCLMQSAYKNGTIIQKVYENGAWAPYTDIAEVETGKWTPVFSDSSLAKLRDGIARYYRIDDIVYCELRVEILKSSEDNFVVSGLPYNPKFNAYGHFLTQAAASANTIKARSGHVFLDDSGNIRPVYTDTQSSNWYMPVSAFGAGNVLDITINYRLRE